MSSQSAKAPASCALYMRLSREDERGMESASIETQRKLLRRFAHEQGFLIWDEYIDDGFSGVSFERPAFLRMQRDIEAGYIQVVLTKDLSRLGRNSGRVSLLLDEYFPRKRVRYISVSDGIDTAVRSRANAVVAPMHSLLNEMYAADLSDKIRAALDIKMREGDFIGAFAPYGYQKSPDNKNRLIPDKKAAAVVREIFALARAGLSPAQIAARLNERRIPTPSRYRYESHRELSADSFPIADLWNGQSVGKILRNQVYLGHTLQGKTEKPSFKSSFTCAKPREKWIIAKHTHEPLVTLETWEIVREKRSGRMRAQEGTSHGFCNRLSGLVKCYDCGKSMSSAGRGQNPQGMSLVCGGYKLNGKRSCTSHRIRYELLLQAVRLSVQREFPGWTNCPEDFSLLFFLIRRISVHEKNHSSQKVEIFFRFSAP